MIDTNRGKLSAQLDLREARGRERARRRFCATPTSSSRATGPAPSRNTASAPRMPRASGRGIVCVSLCAYGYEGRVGEPARLRLARAERQRHERRGGGSRGRGQAAAAAMPGARPRHRLPDGVRRHDRAQAPRHRGRQLARALLARAELALVRNLGRIAERACRARPGFRGRRDCLEERRRTSAAHRRAAFRDMSETPARWVRPSARLGTHGGMAEADGRRRLRRGSS